MNTLSQTRPISIATDWQDSFKSWLERTPTKRHNKKRAESTIDDYMSDVRQFAEYFARVNQTPFAMDLLNKADMESWFAELWVQIAPSTYRRKMAALKMLQNYAQAYFDLRVDLFANIPIPHTTDNSPRELLADERSQLEAACEAYASSPNGQRDNLSVYLMLLGGLRISEVSNLLVGDIDLTKGIMRVVGKNQKVRFVEIVGRLDEMLRNWLASRMASDMDALIPSPRGGALSRTTLWRVFNDRRDLAEISAEITPHNLRHTFVYRYMDIAQEHGIPWHAALSAISQQTGDDPNVILAYYSRARKSDVRAVMGEM